MTMTETKTAVGEIPDFFKFYERMQMLAPMRHSSLREGQYIFNELTAYYPAAAHACIGRYDVDPFNNDTLLPAFWDFMLEIWEDPPPAKDH